MKDLAWQLFIAAFVMLVAVSCGAGIAGALNPVNYSTSYTYTTNNFELNILSGNSEVVGVVGMTIVLIMVVRTLRNGGEG